MQGAADPGTGQVTGGSPDVERRLAELPADVEADVRTVNELLGNSGVPAAVPGSWAAAGRALAAGGAAAVVAQVPGVLVGALGGDWSKVAGAVAAAGTGLAASVAIGLADRAHARLTARLGVQDEARRGASPAVRGVLDAAGARLAAEVDAFRTQLATGREGRTGPLRTARTLPPVGPVTSAEAVGAGEALHGSAPTPVPPSVARYGAWLAKASANPLAGLAGVGVLALLALPLTPALAWGAGAATAAAALVALGQRSLASAKAGLDADRTAVSGARRTATARATAQAELRVEVARREAAEAAGRATRGTADGSARPDLLAPGPVAGPLAPGDLGRADLARLADVARAAEAVRSVEQRGGTASPAELAALRAAVEAAGMTAGTSTEDDPDTLGWPHRRALLDPDHLAVVQGLDTLPSAVPSLRTHLWTAAWGVALPGALTALPGVLLGVGLGPLALVALGVVPAATAVAGAVRQHSAARAVERGSQARSAGSSSLPAAARRVLDAEVADAAAVADARAADATAAAGVAARVDASREARAARLRARSRLRDTVLRPADPAVDLPAAPAEPRPPATATTPPAAPVAVDAPVTARVHDAVTAPLLGAAAAVVAWHAGFADTAGPLWDAATWGQLSGAAETAAIAVVAAAAGAVTAALTTATEAAVDRSRARATERRAAAVTVQEAARAEALREVRLGPLRAARDGLLAEVRRQEVAGIAAALGDEARADAAVPRRPAGLVVRLTEWLRTQTDAVARLVLDGGHPGDPATRAATARLAAGLPDAPRDLADEQVARVLHAARAAELAPGDVPGSPELDRLLELDRGAAPGGSGIDWDHVRRIAAATGWWPQEQEEQYGLRRFEPPAERVAPDPGPPPAPAVPTDDRTGRMPPTTPRPAPPAVPPPVGRTPAVPPSVVPPSAPPPAAPPSVVPPARPVRPPLPYGGPPEPAPVAPGWSVPPAPGPGALVDPWPQGGRTLTAVVEVGSPGGQVMGLLARWVEPDQGGGPVLVLDELPGQPFWWGVPAAVQQAVALALAALVPALLAPGAPRRLPVLARRPGPHGRAELAEFALQVDDRGVPAVVGGLRALPVDEAQAAEAGLRLGPVDQLLGRLAGRSAPVDR